MNELGKLLDRNEIADLLTRLGRWLDGQGGDPAAIYDEDVLVRSPRGEFRGLTRVVEFVQGSDQGERCQHFFTDVLIEVAGDEAVVHANQVAHFYQPGQPPHRGSGLRVGYTAARRPAGWRLTTSEIRLEWIIGELPSA
ncbi:MULTISPECIES: nuclear transport factor 2 family protein [unclassified Crossiella]|uniref:nuclear transport factor 2 family protein n=1 Tax=unclassified Crossiella TaxID=2620835 RepID=UPI0020000A02|nr:MULTISPECIES: nuclear transport factor 2 family protein [unclassified Crossiella]MCK2242856.1 nuclear transport factor 2 family protein [Crossiella sp. S99.2]MCK2256733.1 nuclear transport factor 2 family protein [Crossiella sp. S99.1]